VAALPCTDCKVQGRTLGRMALDALMTLSHAPSTNPGHATAARSRNSDASERKASRMRSHARLTYGLYIFVLFKV
jgi:hypothetical protein